MIGDLFFVEYFGRWRTEVNETRQIRASRTNEPTNHDETRDETKETSLTCSDKLRGEDPSLK